MSRLGKEKACEINTKIEIQDHSHSFKPILIATDIFKIGAMDTLIC